MKIIIEYNIKVVIICGCIAEINTNMYLEFLYKVLKHVYMQGKVNKRLYTCIYLLLKLLKDKTFEMYTSIIKGSSIEKIQDTVIVKLLKGRYF